MAWLDDHPPRTQQFRCPRRQRPSGIIGVHTAESFPDETGPDTGAENVADFIRRRTNYGSYHLLADSDSIIHLVRFECVAYHIGTHGLNEHTIGISAATQAAKWNSLGAGYRDAMVRNMARAAARAARWLKQNYGIAVPARRISLAQALRGERGFLAHGDADPARRTDPGATFPWDDFLGYYADEMNGDDDDMKADEREALFEIRKNLANATDGRVKHPHNDGSSSVFYGVQETWEDTWALVHRQVAKPWEFSDEKPQRWRWFSWAGYGQARRARTEARDANRKLDKVLEQQQAILAAQEGLDTPAVIARIDEHAAENAAALEIAEQQRSALLDALDAAAEERDDLAQMVRQVQTGDLSAEDLVRLMGEKLAATDA